MDPITGIGIVDWFLGFLDTHGYLLVFAFTISENLFIIGSFTPGETIVMAAAFLSTPEQGSLSLILVWLASVVGTTVGSNVSYWIGRRGGRDAALRFGRPFRLDESRLRLAEDYFYRHGSKTVFISRFAAGFKNFVPVIAGISKMPLLYFEGWTLLGAVTYTSLMCAIGYFVGNNFNRALDIAAQLGYVGIVLFVLAIAGIVVGRRRIHRRQLEAAKRDAAEAALAGDAVQPLVEQRLWVRFEVRDEVTSTNDVCSQLARSGAPEGTVVLASAQTAGKGRLGRSWSSPEGGAYLSGLLRPGVPASDAAALPLVIAIGVARGLEHVGVSTRLKWPNDVLTEEGKLAGILLEMSGSSGKVKWVVAGVGLNVGIPAERVEGAAYVHDTVPTVGTAGVAAAVLDGVAIAYDTWRDDGFGSLRDEYEGRSMLIGESVSVSDADGSVLASGMVAGIDGEGRLLVETSVGTESVSVGDVTLRPAAVSDSESR